jgi:predicted permease
MGGSGFRRLFRLPPSPASLARELEEEVQFHLESYAEELRARGLSPEAARAEAARRFGDLDAARAEIGAVDRRRLRGVRRREYGEALRQDLRDAWRGLRREPGLALVVVLTLALGIGANAAMFGVLDRLMLSGPPHVVDADRVFRLYATRTDEGARRTSSGFSYATYEAVRAGAPAFSRLAAYTLPGEVAVGRGEDVEPLKISYATASLFPLLGTRPALGRFYGPAEDTPPAGAPVVVLGYEAWQRRFAGDSSVVGRSLSLVGRPYTVVGVAPRGFGGAEQEPVDLWAPVSSDPSPPTPDWPTSRNARWVHVVGRLAPGATLQRAALEATTVERRAHAAAGAPAGERDVDVSARPLWFDRSGKESLEVLVSRWLVGVAVVVLLVACANVANLLLARSLRRRREVAVRVALGIRRGRLVRLFLAEGMLLAGAGGAAGLLLAYWGGQFLRATLLANMAWAGPPVDARVLVLAGAATLVTGLLVSLLPAVQASRPNLVAALREGTPGAGVRSRLRAGLTIAQAALSVVLLVGAGLFAASLQNVRQLRLGIDTDRVLLVTLTYPRLTELPEAQRAAERARRAALRAELHERLRRVPGVAGTAASAGVPFHSGLGVDVRAEGHDSLPVLPGGGPYVSAVTPDYFATAGTRVLRGRAFTAADRQGAEPVALVSATMARVLWPRGDAIGRCLYVGADTAPCARIVGVAEDVHRFQLREEPALQYYVPLEQVPMGGAVTMVRAAGDPAALVPVIRRGVQQVDPSVRYVTTQLLQDAVSPKMRPWRLGAALFGLFGVLALVVAAIGLYSVMSYATAQRTREMGVRLALGARPGDVGRLVIRSGFTLAAAGIALGVLAAVAGGRWAEPLLFDTSPRDPTVLGGVALALLAVAVVASTLPAWRAARIAPATALRTD